MFERIEKSDNCTKGRDKKSPWMAHWMKPNHSNAVAETRNYMPFKNEELALACGGDSLLNESSGLKELETRGFKILNDGLRMGLESNGNGGMQSSDFKIDELQERGKGMISRNKHQLHPKKYRDEGTSKNPMGWMKSQLPAIHEVSKPLSRVAPFVFNVENREVNKGKANVRNLELGNSHDSLATQFADTPSTSGLHLQQFNQGWLQKMQNCANIGLFPMQFIASEETKAKELQDFPEVLGADTMRIRTMVDSVVGMPGGCPMFSQTTHSMLITKKTDANSFKDENCRNTRVLTEINEKQSNDYCSLPSFFRQGKQGLIIQSLSSSTDSEGKGNVGDVKASKITIRNESSAETNTLDMDSLKEKNQRTGTNSSASIKIGASCSRETGLPDMNLPAGPTPASLSENADPSSSRTQSLDIEFLLAHAEHPKPTFNTSEDHSVKADPNNRWVKRLKLNSSSALSTKSSKLSENLLHEKTSTYFSKILKNNITSSEDLLDNSCDLSKEDEGFSMDLAKKDIKVLLSQTWIQRWLSEEARTTQKKPGNLVVCQPLSSKMELEDLEKKQFPSIAAMALMGKAMSGFQQCELQKRGSFTVWNTKAF